MAKIKLMKINGFQFFTTDDETLTGNKEIIKDYIKKEIIDKGFIRKTINYNHNSYGLKNYIEIQLGIYASNLDIKVAMAELGIEGTKNQFNPCYPVSEKFYEGKSPIKGVVKLW